MDWIKVTPLNGHESRLVRASSIIELQFKSALDVKLVDVRGASYGWTGNVREYADFATALGLAVDE